ncbi:MAG: phosphate-starvation-inducible PsiE family protein [Candidatus Thermoplasmatota archaeon]|nr:phosphate-starvation-inducible PsiE family protein [Candidatus Thermoplasmatota archaeon]
MVEINNLTFKQIKQLIIFILMGMLLLVIFMSIAFLAWNLIDKIFLQFNETIFQNIIIDLFGLFFLVLVGIELFETLQMYTKERVVHVEVVLLVALIAAARKIILIDYTTTPSDIFFGIAAIVVAIGISYFLLKKASSFNKIKE